MVKIFLFSIFVFISIFSANETKLLGNKRRINNTDIKKHTSSFKQEIIAIKRFCTLIGVIGIISYASQGLHVVRSLFGIQQSAENRWTDIIPFAIRQLISFGQYAVISYIIQKLINHGIRYYLYEHPITWLLNHKTPIKQHFDLLFQSVDIITKKNKIQQNTHAIKNTLLLFMENVIKDIEQISAFIGYRIEFLASYKLSTVALIKEEIITLTNTWAETMEKEICKKVIDTDILHACTHQFKLLLFEQIELFKKIDDEVEFLRSLCMLAELT